MKKFLLLVIIILSNLALYSQGLSVFDVETTNFPIIKAKFFAFDNKGNQITNLSASDFDLKENGTARKITNVSCPVPKPSQSVSIGMSLDNSGSMGSPTGSSPLAFGKATAKRLAEQMTIPPSEIAVQSCDDKAIIWTDFTKDKSKYFTSVERVPGGGNNDFVEQLLNQRTGILNIVKTGNLKRIAVLYTDAYWPALTTGELQRCKDTCGKYNISFYAIVYSTPYAEPNGIKSSLKALAEATNGKLYDGVTSLSTVEDLATELQSLVQGGDPCTIEWESGKICKAGLINVELMITPLNISTSAAYNSPDIAEQKLEFTPKTIRFKNAIPGIKTDSMITVTAKNGNFTVTNIVSSDPEFTISPTSFTLNAGQSMNLTLSVVPTDSGYTYCQYSLENDKCPTNYAASTGFKGKKLKTRTLQLLKPNGGEVFLAGTDTIISWEGVLPDEAIKIEFTKNNGANWMVLSDSATGLSYNWKVPKLPGNQCLVRISAKISQNLTVYDNESVQIGRQIWMGYNLDVDRYRNGDSIPEIRNVNTWDSSYVHQIGAWSNCKNEPERGAEYGNLYNWFAVADKRNLAPEGWHIPSENEWDELINYLGGKYEAGWKLMEAGTVHWKSPNGYATNETGFSALPGGFIDVRYNYCDHLHEKGYWWSSTGGGEYVAVVIMSYDFTLLFGPFENYFPYSVRCVKDTLSKTDYQLQYDQSDFVFSIVSPAVASIDVDMKECLLGSTKDSVISSYLTNTGTYPCRIDSIFFTGADSAAFSMISGKPPFIIDTGKSKPVEFHFVPVRTGIHQAKINIITQADTLHQNISGTGVEQKIQVVNKIIDFGVVGLGFSKDTLQAVTIKNVSKNNVTITSTKHIWPNDKDFKTIAGAAPFTLSPGESAKMDLRFTPSIIGRTSGQLEFDFDGTGSPAIVQLFGQGISLPVSVWLPDTVGNSGDENFHIPLKLSCKIDTVISNLTFNAVIRFDATCFAPKFSLDSQKYQNGENIIYFHGNIPQLSKNEKKIFDITGTILMADNSKNIFYLDSFTTNFEGLDITTKNGSLEIHSCAFNISKIALYKPLQMEIYPNPSSELSVINYQLSVDGLVKLSLYNQLGQEVAKIDEGYKTKGSYHSEFKIQNSEFSEGVYFLRLSAGGDIVTEKVMVIK